MPTAFSILVSRRRYAVSRSSGVPSDGIEGQGRWTLKMLADRLVDLEVVDAVSDETVRRVLKKTF